MDFSFELLHMIQSIQFAHWACCLIVKKANLMTIPLFLLSFVQIEFLCAFSFITESTIFIKFTFLFVFEERFCFCCYYLWFRCHKQCLNVAFFFVTLTFIAFGNCVLNCAFEICLPFYSSNDNNISRCLFIICIRVFAWHSQFNSLLVCNWYFNKSRKWEWQHGKNYAYDSDADACLNRMYANSLNYILHTCKSNSINRFKLMSTLWTNQKMKMRATERKWNEEKVCVWEGEK